MSKWTYVSINNTVHSNLTGNDDYIGGLYSVTFSVEVTSVPFDVPIIDDAVLEDKEKFNLVIVPGSLPKSVIRSSPGKATVIIVEIIKLVAIVLANTGTCNKLVHNRTNCLIILCI